MSGFKTGVIPLDGQLPHGVPAGYIMLIEGPLGTGKSFFAITIAATAARQGAPVLFFSFDALPDEVADELRQHGAALERVTVVDGFVAPDEHYSRLKPPIRHRLEAVDARLFIRKLAEFAGEFRRGVVVVDSLNEMLLRSPASASDVIRALKIFTRYTDSVAVVTVHTDMEEIRAVMSAVRHMLDMVIELGTDQEFEKMGVYVRWMRVARARKLRVSHDRVYFEIVNGSVVEIDIKALIKALNKQLAEGLAVLRRGG
jgi:KaiC/GvpD/RAD55 family RecA-like ATPase